MLRELTSRAGQGAMLGCFGSHYTGDATDRG